MADLSSKCEAKRKIFIVSEVGAGRDDPNHEPFLNPYDKDLRAHRGAANILKLSKVRAANNFTSQSSNSVIYTLLLFENIEFVSIFVQF